MSVFADHVSPGLIIAVLCAAFLAIVGLFVAYLVPFTIVRLLRELIAESRKQTALLERLAKNGEPRSEAASEPLASRESRPQRIPGIN